VAIADYSIAMGDARRKHLSRLPGLGVHALESLTYPLRRAWVATLLRTGYSTGRFCVRWDAGYLSPQTARLVSVSAGPWASRSCRLRAGSAGSLRNATGDGIFPLATDPGTRPLRSPDTVAYLPKAKRVQMAVQPPPQRVRGSALL